MPDICPIGMDDFFRVEMRSSENVIRQAFPEFFKEQENVIKKRNPVFAGILSLLTPGMGHLYSGAPRKGLSLIAIQYGVVLVSGILGLLSTFYGIAAYFAFSIVIHVYAISSSVMLALQNKEHELKSYNRWYWYLLLFVVVTTFSNIVISYRGSILGYESYRISSSSMEPTLQPGDFITVDTRHSDPMVGDVIVFLNPQDRRIPFVMRVAAVGNDTLSITNGIAIHNGKAIDTVSVPESSRQLEFSISMKEKHVPEDEIFVLGDWRDNSNDSRFWGTVPAKDVIGKVTYIWYSKNAGKIGTKVE